MSPLGVLVTVFLVDYYTRPYLLWLVAHERGAEVKLPTDADSLADVALMFLYDVGSF